MSCIPVVSAPKGSKAMSSVARNDEADDRDIEEEDGDCGSVGIGIIAAGIIW